MAPRKEKLKTFTDEVEERVNALVSSLETPMLLWKDAGHLWRIHAKSALDGAKELALWYDMQRERERNGEA